MGIPGELIQVFGDWHSDAYKCYLDISMPLKLQVFEGMVAHLRAGLACSDIGCLAGLAGREVVIVSSPRLSLVGGFLNNKVSLCAKQSVSQRLLFVVFSLRRKLIQVVPQLEMKQTTDTCLNSSLNINEQYHHASVIVGL